MQWLRNVMPKLYSIVTLATVLYYVLPIHNVDAELAPLYQKYMNQVEQHCSWYQYYHPGHVNVRIEHLNYKPVKRGDEIGYCWKQLNGYNVVIDESFWKGADENQRYEVLAHELTHCLFFKGHSENSEDFMAKELGHQENIPRQVDTLIRATCS